MVVTNLAWHSMGLTDLVTPVTTAHRNDWQFGKDNGTTNSCCYLLRALHTKTNMSIAVSNGNKGLEACTLSCSGLFLHWHDFENFIFKGSPKEEVNDLVLLKNKKAYKSKFDASITAITITNKSKPSQRFLANQVPWWEEKTCRFVPGFWSSCPWPSGQV